MLYCNMLNQTYKKGENMLHIKNVKKIGELQDFFCEQEKASDTIVDIYKKFSILKTAKMLNKYKKKGYLATDVLLVLLHLPFFAVSSIRALIKSGNAKLSEAQQDVYYRLKNNSNICWRLLQYCFCKRFEKLAKENENKSNEVVKCFIIDDTLLPKTGKTIEGIGKVFDHITRRCLLGFKALVLGYFDGKSFLPLDFSLHNEKGKNKNRPYGLSKKEIKERYRKHRDVRSAGAKRKQELSTSKIDNALSMLKRAVKHGFQADYLLMDKWFISEVVIRTVRKIKKYTLHVIAACKMDKRKYIYEDKEYTAKELLRNNKKRMHRSKRLRAYYVELIVEYKGFRLKLFFNRFSKRGNWELLITTDTKLTFNKLMQIYSIRWSIEVFFKESKQYLKLGSCQSQDFDAQIADITICMIQYIILSLYKRKSSYETIGELFRNSKELMVELTIADRLWQLFLSLQLKIAQVFEIDVNDIIEQMIQTPDYDNKILKILILLSNEQEKVSFNNAA